MALFQAGQRLLIKTAANCLATLLKQEQLCKQKQRKTYNTGRHRHFLIHYTEVYMLRSPLNIMKDF